MMTITAKKFTPHEYYEQGSTCLHCGLSKYDSIHDERGFSPVSHEQPASARVEENTKMYTRESRQTKQHVHTCMFCGQSGTEISNGEQLQYLGNRAEELSSLLAGMTTERDGLYKQNERLRYSIKIALDKVFNDGKREGWVEIQQSAIDKLYAALNHAEQGEGSEIE